MAMGGTTEVRDEAPMLRAGETLSPSCLGLRGLEPREPAPRAAGGGGHGVMRKGTVGVRGRGRGRRGRDEGEGGHKRTGFDVLLFLERIASVATSFCLAGEASSWAESWITMGFGG